MFEPLPPNGDQLFEACYKQNIKPLVWHDLGGNRRSIGGVAEMELSCRLGFNVRDTLIESMKVVLIDGRTVTFNILQQGLKAWHIPDPPGHSMGVFGFFEEANAPNAQVLMQQAFMLAQHGEWRLVHCLEWADVVTRSRTGELRPQGVLEPEGQRWRPLSPIYEAGKETLIYWGLIDVQALVLARQNGGKVAVLKYHRTTLDGVPVQIVKNPDGSKTVRIEEVVVPHTQRIPRPAAAPPSTGDSSARA